MANIWFVLAFNTLAFGVNFFLWTMLAVIGFEFKDKFALSVTQFSFLLATPFVTASLLRIPIDMLAERFSGRLIQTLQLVVVAFPCWGLSTAENYWQLIIWAALLGVSGATFCLGISFASKYFPQAKQGLALAMYSAGVLGLVFTLVALPDLLARLGVTTLLSYSAVFTLVFAGVYAALTLTRKLPRVELPETSLRARFAHIKSIRVWRFGLYYFFVFGCFMATALWLPYVYQVKYGLSIEASALYSLWLVIPTILGRKLALVIAEKYTATTINWSVFWTSIVCLFFLSFPSTSISIHGIDRVIHLDIKMSIAIFSALLAVMGLAMGVGTSSVYRLISKYFPSNRHGISCLVSSIGALGGFVLLALFGLLLDVTSIITSCFILLYIVLGSCMIWMYYAIKRDELDQRVKQALDSNFLQRGKDPFS